MKSKLLTILVLCGVSTVSSADAYWGIGFGKINYEYDYYKSTAIEMYFGNRINDNFAMELGFIDTGETEDKEFDDTRSGTSISITAKLIAEIGDDFEVQLFAGAHQWELKIIEYDEFSGDDDKFTIDDRDLFYGVGANIEISSGVMVGLNHRIYDINEEDIAFTSLNFEFEF